MIKARCFIPIILSLNMVNIQWSTQSIDIGTIAYDSTVNTQIYAVNKSGEPWQIENIQSACGCLSTIESGKHIGDGDTFKLKLRFKPQKKGIQQKSIVVYSNLGLFEIWLKANVKN
jgi:hypothetical protein